MKSLLFATFFYITNAAFSQNISIEWSTKVKYSREDFYKTLEIDNNRTLAIVSKRASTFSAYFRFGISVLDEDLKELSTEYIDFLTTENSKIIDFINKGNSTYLIYSEYLKEGNFSIGILHVDRNSGKMLEKKQIGIYKKTDKYNILKTQLSFSLDSSKALLFIHWDNSKKINKKFSIVTFNNQFEQIIKKDIELTIEEKYISFYSTFITNSGDVFISYKHFEDKVEEDDGLRFFRNNSSFTFHLLKIDKKDVTISPINIASQNNFIEGLRFIESSDKSILLTGLYKIDYKGNINGTFFGKLEEGKTSVKMIFSPFSKEILELIDQDDYGSVKGSDAGISKYFIPTEVIYRSNNTVDLISEYQYQKSHTSSGGAVNYNYEYGDIVVTNFNMKGEAKFVRIPKFQANSGSAYFCGYYALPYKDNLIILYDDKKSNVESDINSKPDRIYFYKKSSLIAAIINNKNELKRDIITEHKEDGFVTDVSVTKKINESKYFISSIHFGIKLQKMHGFLNIAD